MSLKLAPTNRHDSPKAERRKALGAYYTPPALVDHLIQTALGPVIEAACRQDDPARALSALRICDPACGAGAFLIPAARRLGEALAGVSGFDVDFALKEVTARCIVGWDIDPEAVRVCRRALARQAELDDSAVQVSCRDALWVGGEGMFDAILTNPPFLNAIERRKDSDACLRAAYPELGGTADCALYFLALADRLVRPDGWIGMVLPRAALGATAGDRLRRDMRHRPREIGLLAQSDSFDDADIYVTLATLGPAGPATVVDGARHASGELGDPNWWRGARTLLDGPATAQARSPSAAFQVEAGMTVGEAYIAARLAADEPAGAGQRLITTGMIGLGECRWGERPFRFLGRRLSYPRLAPSYEAPASLVRRLERSTRPKLIVAGLARCLRCYLDELGECQGFVSTYHVTVDGDALDQLRALQTFLHGEQASERFRRELGASALGGGSITLTKRFLQDLIR